MQTTKKVHIISSSAKEKFALVGQVGFLPLIPEYLKKKLTSFHSIT